MARVKLSEYRAKSLLVPNYSGVTVRFEHLEDDLKALDKSTTYVIKVDQGIKKRGKQGLLRLGVTYQKASAAVTDLAKKGYDRFVAEPMVEHVQDEERYVSFERFRDRIAIHYSDRGGVDIEDNTDTVKQYTVDDVPLPRLFVEHVMRCMDQEHLSFVELNPLIVRGEDCLLLDAAVLVDSAGSYAASWTDDDIVETDVPTEAEATIATMNSNSPAAFSFRVLNKDGAIWLLLSGGGASITIADEASNKGKAALIGNYGEYSGGPTREETYLYTAEVIKQVLASNAPKKAIVIAGGVANFTDVRKTFGGIIQALEERVGELVAARIKVFVRRGGPNEKEGLKMMETFLKENELYGSVHGSRVVLTDVINEALEHVDA